MGRRLGWLLASAAAAAGALVIVGGLWVYTELRAPYLGWEGEAAVVEIPRGCPAGQALRRLGQAGVIRAPGLVRLWVVLRGGATRLQAGEYRFDRAHTPLEVLRRLEQGEVWLHPVTVPEGLSLEETAVRLAEAGFGSVEALREAFADPDPIRVFDPDAPDLEGYLFPDTYHFPRGVAPQEVARAMARRFLEVVGDDYRVRVARLGLTARQAVTLASMIEKETSVAEERRRVSRVFHNRLARGMRLECDPTVLYALEREGRPVGRLLYAHLEFDSPWNTYRITGLPPGPICSPGRESLEAAADPEPGDWLYFVASPGGGHRFSRDLEEHQRAVQLWREYRRSRP